MAKTPQAVAGAQRLERGPKATPKLAISAAEAFAGAVLVSLTLPVVARWKRDYRRWVKARAA